MAETEKITINVDVVDLGKIDLLVEQGFYSTRTDLIKSSIRNELNKHEFIVNEHVVKKSYTLGITKLSSEYLQKTVDEGQRLDVKVIGMLLIDEDVSVNLAKTAIATLTVHGAFKAKPEIKALFQ